MIKPKNILLVDDDEDDQNFFMEAVNEIDNSICLRIANNGVEALAQLNGMYELPDLIFLDINMPLMNGFECLTQLKKQNRFKTIPVIILSTSNNSAETELARMLGAFFFLYKPSEFSLLKKNVACIVDLYSTPMIKVLNYR
jgi:CheY-like chemotaxis protein